MHRYIYRYIYRYITGGTNVAEVGALDRGDRTFGQTHQYIGTYIYIGIYIGIYRRAGEQHTYVSTICLLLYIDRFPPARLYIPIYIPMPCVLCLILCALCLLPYACLQRQRLRSLLPPVLLPQVEPVAVEPVVVEPVKSTT